MRTAPVPEATGPVCETEIGKGEHVGGWGVRGLSVISAELFPFPLLCSYTSLGDAGEQQSAGGRRRKAEQHQKPPRRPRKCGDAGPQTEQRFEGSEGRQNRPKHEDEPWRGGPADEDKHPGLFH